MICTLLIEFSKLVRRSSPERLHGPVNERAEIYAHRGIILVMHFAKRPINAINH